MGLIITDTRGPDVTPPVLQEFSFTPTAVDVSTNSAPVTVTFHVSDDLSGFAQGGVLLRSPSGGQLLTAPITPPPVSGTVTHGIYQFTRTVPAFSEPGTWMVENVDLFDAVGNRITLSTAQLQAAGFPTALTVIGP